MTNDTTQAETIAAMQRWAMDNYSNGADTMAECWSASDYAELFTDCDGNPKTTAQAWATLRSLADVYSERQADARNSVF
jgi:hypothetical protein